MEEINEDNINQILNQSEYLLFYFTAKWCGPCQKIKPMILKLKDGLQTDKIKFYMIDIDENDDLCDKCKITSVPTFILFKDKESVGIVNGSNIVSVAELIKPYC
jgi:thioredoxin 1